MVELSRDRNAGLMAGNGEAGEDWPEIAVGLTGYFRAMRAGGEALLVG